ncbi:hypothetical protein VMCG_10094 [Cytospora schulzeri]|uniref:Uncharacterized protein n=1 Tax=Cytospora schulzeri TaxID=448051 RepID=A0A423VGC0_9PEZI|nr:hypothetical protein VMCG_10094 [Valsa malicola]
MPPMAGPPLQSSPDALAGPPKDSSSSPPSPPPAYYPSALHLRQQQMIRRVMSNPPYPVSEADFGRLRAQHASVMESVHGGQQEENMVMDDEDDEDDDGHSPVNLRISTALHVQGDNNAVLLNATPVDHAKAVAQAVVSAIRQCSDVNGGIPMIDEEGRPRPFNIVVDAGVGVEGSGNLLGNEKHIMRFLSGGSDSGSGKRKREDGDDGERRGSHRRWRRMRRSSV